MNSSVERDKTLVLSDDHRFTHSINEHSYDWSAQQSSSGRWEADASGSVVTLHVDEGDSLGAPGTTWKLTIERVEQSNGGGSKIVIDQGYQKLELLSSD